MKNNETDWCVEWTIGHKEIDEQHKNLLDIIKSLGLAIKLGKGQEFISKVFFKLEDYVKVHFEFEENLLRTTNNLPSDKHLMEHHEFLMTLGDLRFDYVSSDEDLSGTVYDFLIDWLTNHIMGTDKKELELVVESPVQ